MRPAPAFQCYAGNIIVDKRYRLMTPIERSVWVSIYFECWPNHSVPAEPDELARYLGYPVEIIKAGLTERVLSFFKIVKGELICPELDEYRETLRIRNLMKSAGGKKGAELKRIKASNRLGDVKGTPEGKPEGSLIQSNINQTNQNQSIKKTNSLTNDSFVKDIENYEEGYKWP